MICYSAILYGVKRMVAFCAILFFFLKSLMGFLVNRNVFINYWPILAHIERFPQLLEEPDRLLGWIERGILCQCNTGSFTGYFGPKVKERVRTLYQNGVIHLLGSDGHRMAFRTTDIREAHEELERLARKEKRDDLWQTATANAEFILKGSVLFPEVPERWHKKKKGFFSRLFG